MTPSPRRIQANLDAEDRMAEASLGASRITSSRALRVSSAIGTLLSVLARPGDELWTLADSGSSPERFDPPPLVDLIDVSRRVGAPELGRDTPTISWSPTGIESSDPETQADGSIASYLWSTQAASPELALELNHRRHVIDWRSAAAAPSLDAVYLESFADFRAWVEAAPQQLWIAKAPYSAAGRARFLGRGVGDLAQPSLAELWSRYRGLLFERWVERNADYGVTLWIDESIRVISVHRQYVDARGQFQGLRLLNPEEIPNSDWLRVAVQIGETLYRHGYRGPAGIDAYEYQTAAGVEFQPVGEVNVRMTLGLIAKAWAEYLGVPRIELQIDTSSEPVPPEFQLLAASRDLQIRLRKLDGNDDSN